MATESFYEDMIIDTPEAAANLESFVKEGVCLTVDSTVEVKHADDKFLEELGEIIRNRE